MAVDTRARHNAELSFFKTVQTRYNAELEDCGDIQQSLTRLKKAPVCKALPPAKWARLYQALRTGEITRGKKSTPGDWAAAEVRLLKAELRGPVKD